jgi:arylsulfatase A-like enzyme
LLFGQTGTERLLCPTPATLMTGLDPHQAGIGYVTPPIREDP